MFWPLTKTLNLVATHAAGAWMTTGVTAAGAATAGAGVRLTVAWAVAVTVWPLPVPVTVITSVWLAPDAPLNGPVNEHGALVAPGASVTPMNAPHVLPGSPARSP